MIFPGFMSGLLVIDLLSILLKLIVVVVVSSPPLARGEGEAPEGAEGQEGHQSKEAKQENLP